MKSLLADSYLVDIPTLIVEGITDYKTLEYIIGIKSEKLKSAIENKKMRLFTMEGHGGVSQMINWVKAWKYSGFKSKLYILFDKDLAGKKAKEEINNIPHSERPQNFKCQFWKPSPIIVKEIIGKLHCGGDFLFEMEHLYSIEFWEELKELNYVEHRNEIEIKNSLFNEIDFNDSFQDVMKRKITSEDVRATLFCIALKTRKISNIRKS